MLILLGADLFDKDFQKKLNKIIQKSKPRVVMHELMFDDSVTTSKKARDRLLSCDEGGVCDPRVNKKLYQQIAKSVGFTKFYGVLPPYDEHTSNPMDFIRSPRFFRMKERAMTPEIIKRTKKASYSQLVIAVVADKHLRNDSDGDRYSQGQGWSYLIRQLTNQRIPFVVYRKEFIDKQDVNELSTIIKYQDISRYL